MSRYKEERANEILAINLTKMVDREEQSYSSIEEMKKLPEWDCTISAMCQLAEEVKNTCNMELYVIKLYLSKLIEKEQYSKDFHIKFLLEEANKCSLTLYTKEQIKELQQQLKELENGK